MTEENVEPAGQLDSAPTTKGYDIPSSDGLSADEAAAQINRIMADVSGNSNHPYSNKLHPQHKEFMDGMQGLFEAKTINQASPLEQTMQDALEQKAEKQSALVERAKAESKFLDEYEDDSFSSDDIPDDIAEWQISLLTEKRLIHQGNYGGLLYMFEKDVRDLNIPSSTVEPFRQLVEIEGLDPATAEIAALHFLDIIKEYSFRKYGRAR